MKRRYFNGSALCGLLVTDRGASGHCLYINAYLRGYTKLAEELSDPRKK
jgi:hypothetical protein